MSKDELKHYGTPRHSGRYPWGSGKEPYQSSTSFDKRYKDLRAAGYSEVEATQALGMNTGEFRRRNSVESEAKRAENISYAKKLRDKGMSYTAIGERMGRNESTIRSWLAPGAEKKANQVAATVDVLKQEVKEKKYIDVGKGTNVFLGVSEERLKTSIQKLKDEGYNVYDIYTEQLTQPGNWTRSKILTAANTTKQQVLDHITEIGVVGKKFVDKFATTALGLLPVKSISSKRVEVAYKEDGGADKDGVIELRPGVKDLSLGNARYAQVRIGVDDKYFLKGMAVYSDDLPDGVDIRYNTNKSKINAEGKEVSKTDIFKPMKTDGKGNIDTDNPFGTSIKDGPIGQRGYINVVYEEGDWNTWAKRVSSQVLSKQPVPVAKKQLNMEYQNKKNDLDVISKLTNPVLKKHLLKEFADKCDTSASHLQAAAFPRQESKVILPLTSIKENQIYAPSFNNGETVVLIRYPHGGIFEIPELTVNNGNREAKKLFKGRAAEDAVGINPEVAKRLSGADFDGDTVVVIPNNNRTIKTSQPLDGLRNFDPSEAYPGYPGMKQMSESRKQTEMGKITNLVTDMTIQKANPEEIARAVRHTMVVIDAVKHNLDYELSYKQNGIAQLKEKYQGSAKSGAATLISRANAEVKVEQNKRYYKIDPETGEKIQEKSGDTYINSKGEKVARLQNTTRMKETSDARTLSSGTAIEEVYADYANKVKGLANLARKEIISTKDIVKSPNAKKVYSEEVASLDFKLKEAQKNAPLERKAQILANQIYWAKYHDNPEMDKDRQKKVKQQALMEARNRVETSSRKSRNIDITPREWEAIQAGAISKTRQEAIFRNADSDKLRELAMPSVKKIMTPSKIAMAKTRLDAGYSWSEVAQALGVSVSTLQKAVNG